MATAIWPLSTRVKRSRISARRRADGDGAGDVGGAVAILRAGIDQVERVRRDPPRGLRRHAVVDDGAVRAGAGDGVEGDVDELRAVARGGLGAEGLQLLGRGDLVDACRAARPGRARRGSAPSPRRRGYGRGARRRARWRSCAPWAAPPGRRASTTVPPACADGGGDGVGGRLRVEHHLGARLAERGEARRRAPTARGSRRGRRARRARRWRACARRRTASACPSPAGWRRRASPDCGRCRCRGC